MRNAKEMQSKSSAHRLMLLPTLVDEWLSSTTDESLDRFSDGVLLNGPASEDIVKSWILQEVENEAMRQGKHGSSTALLV